MSEHEEADSRHVRGRQKKRAVMGNVRDPENRSNKGCACGGHSRWAKKKRKPRDIRSKP